LKFYTWGLSMLMTQPVKKTSSNDTTKGLTKPYDVFTSTVLKDTGASNVNQEATSLVKDSDLINRILSVQDRFQFSRPCGRSSVDQKGHQNTFSRGRTDNTKYQSPRPIPTITQRFVFYLSSTLQDTIQQLNTAK